MSGRKEQREMPRPYRKRSHRTGLWGPITGSLRGILKGHKDMIWGVAILLGVRLCIIRLRDPTTEAPRSILEGFPNSVNKEAYLLDG